MTQEPSPDCIFNKKIRINYSDLDFRGRLKIISILNILQDSASIHASKLGISGFELARKNFAWVVSRYQIKIVKLPGWNDDISIKTWRVPFKNLYEFRYFNIKDKTGSDIINAAGIWIMVKKENCRPVRLSRFLPDFMSNANLNMTVENSDILDKILKLPETIHCQIPFIVRINDLDLNQHVNNAVYLEWAVETIPWEFAKIYRPEKIDISFHKASFYGDTILSKTEIVKNSSFPATLHTITGNRQKIPVEFARVNIEWAPSEP